MAGTSRTENNAADFKGGVSINGAPLFQPQWTTQMGNGAIFAAMGDGDPLDAVNGLGMGQAAGPTPTNIGTAVARCVKFRLPVNLAPINLRAFGVGATSNLYKWAIYADPANGGARLWESGPISTTANSWAPVMNISGVTLAAYMDYWLAITANGTGTTTGYRSTQAPLGSAMWGANSGPLTGRDVGMPVYAQFALATASTFPAVMPALAAAAYAGGTTGSVPTAFVVGAAS